MNENSSNWASTQLVEIPLTEREQRLRDLFVAEYLIDYDYTAAAVRIGFATNNAVEFGQKFKYDPYVQRRISESMGAEHTDPEFMNVVTKRRIINTLMKEAHYTGAGSSHSARVAALAKLSNIKGMDAPTKTETKVKHEGEQKIEITSKFDFSKLDREGLSMVRTLLESQIEEE